MSLRVFPIVEGHGEEAAVPELLRRIGLELCGGSYIDVLTPHRLRRSKMTEPDDLERAVRLGTLKLRHARGEMRSLVLVLLDADNDLPCELGPRLSEQARDFTDVDVTCVVANVEYETWFVAAAESLDKYLDVPATAIPADPEAGRSKKAWIQQRFRRPKYSETVDQPAMTATMDLGLCRRRSPSFDKLCREIEARLGESP